MLYDSSLVSQACFRGREVKSRRYLNLQITARLLDLPGTFSSLPVFWVSTVKAVNPFVPRVPHLSDDTWPAGLMGFLRGMRRVMDMEMVEKA